MPEVLSWPIDSLQGLEAGSRTCNSLRRGGVERIGELITYAPHELMRFWSFGVQGLKVTKKALEHPHRLQLSGHEEGEPNRVLIFYHGYEREVTYDLLATLKLRHLSPDKTSRRGVVFDDQHCVEDLSAYSKKQLAARVEAAQLEKLDTISRGWLPLNATERTAYLDWLLELQM